MSMWWMVVIVPLFTTVGFLFGEIRGSSKELDRRDAEVTKICQPETVKPVTVRARRDIPLDVWYDRVSKSDAKAAAAQLQVSMAQQIATEAAQYVQVTYCYDPVKQVYEISARMRVVPWRSWE